MAQIEYHAISKIFGKERALHDFNLKVESGELVSILGPSGCGKTTALRLLAGFIEPNEGHILVGGKDVVDIPAERRGFGVVFQSYSLFPNMTAEENIDFALKLRKVTPEYRQSKVSMLFDLINMGEHRKKFPHQLSGGQQQRVALARALAIEPPILLLDEPLSALDANVRGALRDEIRSLQRRLGITTIFVTHDQNEAMVISDRVALMRAGQVEQVGTPKDLYLRPLNSFVASFVGTINQIRVTSAGSGVWSVLDTSVSGPTSGKQGVAYIRPEDVGVVVAESGAGVIQEVYFLGSFLRLRVEITAAHSTELLADVSLSQGANLQVGARVDLSLDSENILIEVSK